MRTMLMMLRPGGGASPVSALLCVVFALVFMGSLCVTPVHSAGAIQISSLYSPASGCSVRIGPERGIVCPESTAFPLTIYGVGFAPNNNFQQHLVFIGAVACTNVTILPNGGALTCTAPKLGNQPFITTPTLGLNPGLQMNGFRVWVSTAKGDRSSDIALAPSIWVAPFPNITSISGCTKCTKQTNSACSCSTQGTAPITIVGRNLYGAGRTHVFLQHSLNASYRIPCRTILNNSDTLVICTDYAQTCDLALTIQNNPFYVFVSVDQLTSSVDTSTPTLSFAPRPLIYSVSGCVDVGVSTQQCPLNGLTALTVKGLRFNLSSPVRVYVGPTVCSTVTIKDGGTVICTGYPYPGPEQAARYGLPLTVALGNERTVSTTVMVSFQFLCSNTSYLVNGMVCGGHGTCVSGQCVCFSDATRGYWAGESCTECQDWFMDASTTNCTALRRICPIAITSGRVCNEPFGTCGADSRCVCSNNWDGVACEDCAIGMAGPTCSIQCPLGLNGIPCSGAAQGTCDYGHAATGVCFCKTGFGGPNCAYACPRGEENGAICSGHGLCNATDATCVCFSNALFQQLASSLPSALLEAFGRSNENSTLQRILQLVQASTPTSSAAMATSLLGTWTDLRCDLCAPGFAGWNCTAQCPLGLFDSEHPYMAKTSCASHGVCDDGFNGTGNCSCFFGWVGPNCASECPGGAAVPCFRHGVCLYNEEAGWAYCECLNHFDSATGCAQCEYGWSGDFCDRGPCALNPFTREVCSGDPCVDGRCICAEGTCDEGCYRGRTDPAILLGDDAPCPSQIKCIRNGLKQPCSGHGFCSTIGQCYCDLGYKGVDCELLCPRSAYHRICSDTGYCYVTVNESVLQLTGQSLYYTACACIQGFVGPLCQYPCPGGWREPCANRGICEYDPTVAANISSSDGGNLAVCRCHYGFFGSYCELACPGGALNPCRGLGYCNNQTRKCECRDHYAGVECDQCKEGWYGPTCEWPCFHGAAVDHLCKCYMGYAGPACNVTCVGGSATPCSGHGKCDVLTGQCTCTYGWVREDCSASCPGTVAKNSPCSGHGTCLPSGLCACQFSNTTGYWDGADCGQCSGDFLLPSCLHHCPFHADGRLCGNGQCNVATGVCDCFGNLTHGFWAGDTCNGCRPGAFGPFCAPCPFGLSNRALTTIPTTTSTSNANAILDVLTSTSSLDSFPCWAICSGHGVCADGLTGSGLCRCFATTTNGFWTGDACDGCQDGYYGKDCLMECPVTAVNVSIGPGQYALVNVVCSGHGACSDGIAGDGHCVCQFNWAGYHCGQCASSYFGPNCSTICPGTTIFSTSTSTSSSQPCSGHGFCDEGVSGSGECHCASGYVGPACDLQCPTWDELVCNGVGYCINTGAYRLSSSNVSSSSSSPIITLASISALILSSTTSTASSASVRKGDAQCLCEQSSLFGYWAGTACEVCAAGWAGRQCSTPCPGLSTNNICNGHGVCATGRNGDGSCRCDLGFAGSACDVICPGPTSLPCNGRGTCNATSGACECFADTQMGFWTGEECSECLEGYSGTSCQQLCPVSPEHVSLIPTICAGTGNCFNGHCNCTDGSCGIACEMEAYVCVMLKCPRGRGWLGPKCDRECPGRMALYPGTIVYCFGHGQCDDGTRGLGTCTCFPGYAGLNCSLQCPVGSGESGVCSGHGICNEQTGQCDCLPWFATADCSVRCAGVGLVTYEEPQEIIIAGLPTTITVLRTTMAPCSGHGQCNQTANGDGRCQCVEGFAGLRCASQCPSTSNQTCSGHGVCNSTSATCHCLDWWQGSVCDRCAVSRHGENCELVCEHGYSLGSRTCFCEDGWLGLNCSVQCPIATIVVTTTTSSSNEVQIVCAGHGHCELAAASEAVARCICDVGWYGVVCNVSCNASQCFSSLVSNRHAICIDPSSSSGGSGSGGSVAMCGCANNEVEGHWSLESECTRCPLFYWGPECSFRCACNGHGGCDRVTGQCQCFNGSAVTIAPSDGTQLATTIDPTGHFAGEDCSICQTGFAGPLCDMQTFPQTRLADTATSIPVSPTVFGNGNGYVLHSPSYGGVTFAVFQRTLAAFNETSFSSQIPFPSVASVNSTSTDPNNNASSNPSAVGEDGVDGLLCTAVLPSYGNALRGWIADDTTGNLMLLHQNAKMELVVSEFEALTCSIVSQRFFGLLPTEYWSSGPKFSPMQFTSDLLQPVPMLQSPILTFVSRWSDYVFARTVGADALATGDVVAASGGEVQWLWTDVSKVNSTGQTGTLFVGVISSASDKLGLRPVITLTDVYITDAAYDGYRLLVVGVVGNSDSSSNGMMVTTGNGPYLGQYDVIAGGSFVRLASPSACSTDGCWSINKVVAVASTSEVFVAAVHKQGSVVIARYRLNPTTSAYDFVADVLLAPLGGPLQFFVNSINLNEATGLGYVSIQPKGQPASLVCFRMDTLKIVASTKLGWRGGGIESGVSILPTTLAGGLSTVPPQVLVLLGLPKLRLARFSSTVITSLVPNVVDRRGGTVVTVHGVGFHSFSSYSPGVAPNTPVANARAWCRFTPITTTTNTAAASLSSPLRLDARSVVVLARSIFADYLLCEVPPSSVGLACDDQETVEVAMGAEQPQSAVQFSSSGLHIRRIDVPIVKKVIPVRNSIAALSQQVTVTGRGFLNTSYLVCRFSPSAAASAQLLLLAATDPTAFFSPTAMFWTSALTSPATYIDPYTVHCLQPVVPQPSPQPTFLEISLDGQAFSDAQIEFAFIGPPVGMEVEFAATTSSLSAAAIAAVSAVIVTDDPDLASFLAAASSTSSATIPTVAAAAVTTIPIFRIFTIDRSGHRVLLIDLVNHSIALAIASFSPASNAPANSSIELMDNDQDIDDGGSSQSESSSTSGSRQPTVVTKVSSKGVALFDDVKLAKPPAGLLTFNVWDANAVLKSMTFSVIISVGEPWQLSVFSQPQNITDNVSPLGLVEVLLLDVSGNVVVQSALMVSATFHPPPPKNPPTYVVAMDTSGRYSFVNMSLVGIRERSYVLNFSVPTRPAIATIQSNRIWPRTCRVDEYGIVGDTDCYACLEHTYCNGSTVILMADNYWRASESTFVVYPCGPGRRCQGNTTTGKCLPGFRGARCAACDAGRTGNECSPCLGGGRVGAWFHVVAAFLLLLLIWGFFTAINSLRATPIRDAIPILCKMFLNHLYIINIVGRFADDLPTAIYKTVDVERSIVAFDGLPSFGLIECAVYSPESNDHGGTYALFVMYALWPLILVVLTPLVAIVYAALLSLFEKDDHSSEAMAHVSADRKAAMAAEKERHLALQRVIGAAKWCGIFPCFMVSLRLRAALYRIFLTTFCVALYFSHPMLIRAFSRLIVCNDIAVGKGVQSFLSTDMDINCADPYYVGFHKAAIALLILYTLGIPALFLAVLRVSVRQQGIRFARARFTFLTVGYRTRRVYWEAIVMVVKAIFVIIQSFNMDRLLQSLISSLIAFLLLGLHYHLWPYAYRHFNVMELFSLFSILLVAHLTVCYRLEFFTNTDSAAFWVLTIVLIAIHLIIGVVFVGWIVLAFVRAANEMSTEVIVDANAAVGTSPAQQAVAASKLGAHLANPRLVHIRQLLLQEILGQPQRHHRGRGRGPGAANAAVAGPNVGTVVIGADVSSSSNTNTNNNNANAVIAAFPSSSAASIPQAGSFSNIRPFDGSRSRTFTANTGATQTTNSSSFGSRPGTFQSNRRRQRHRRFSTATSTFSEDDIDDLEPETAAATAAADEKSNAKANEENTGDGQATMMTMMGAASFLVSHRELRRQRREQRKQQQPLGLDKEKDLYQGPGGAAAQSPAAVPTALPSSLYVTQKNFAAQFGSIVNGIAIRSSAEAAAGMAIEGGGGGRVSHVDGVPLDIPAIVRRPPTTDALLKRLPSLPYATYAKWKFGNEAQGEAGSGGPPRLPSLPVGGLLGQHNPLQPFRLPPSLTATPMVGAVAAPSQALPPSASLSPPASLIAPNASPRVVAAAAMVLKAPPVPTVGGNQQQQQQQQQQLNGSVGSASGEAPSGLTKSPTGGDNLLAASVGSSVAGAMAGGGSAPNLISAGTAGTIASPPTVRIATASGSVYALTRNNNDGLDVIYGDDGEDHSLSAALEKVQGKTMSWRSLYGRMCQHMDIDLCDAISNRLSAYTDPNGVSVQFDSIPLDQDNELQGALAFVMAVPHLTHVSMGQCQLSDDHIYTIVSTLLPHRALRYLSLEDNQLTNAAVPLLRRLVRPNRPFSIAVHGTQITTNMGGFLETDAVVIQASSLNKASLTGCSSRQILLPTISGKVEPDPDVAEEDDTDNTTTEDERLEDEDEDGIGDDHPSPERKRPAMDGFTGTVGIRNAKPHIFMGAAVGQADADDDDDEGPEDSNDPKAKVPKRVVLGKINRTMTKRKGEQSVSLQQSALYVSGPDKDDGPSQRSISRRHPHHLSSSPPSSVAAASCDDEALPKEEDDVGTEDATDTTNTDAEKDDRTYYQGKDDGVYWPSSQPQAVDLLPIPNVPQIQGQQMQFDPMSGDGDDEPQYITDEFGKVYQYDPLTGTCYADGILYTPDGAMYSVPEEALREQQAATFSATQWHNDQLSAPGGHLATNVAHQPWDGGYVGGPIGGGGSLIGDSATTGSGGS